MRGVGVEKDIMERIKPPTVLLTSVCKVTSWPLEANTEMVNEAIEVPSIYVSMKSKIKILILFIVE